MGNSIFEKPGGVENLASDFNANFGLHNKFKNTTLKHLIFGTYKTFIHKKSH